MAHRREYYLYKRHKKGGDYWYVCFLDKETGKAKSAKSIDCLKERLEIMGFGTIVRKEDAAIVASKAIEMGITDNANSKILFSSWCKDFWSYDTSEYIALKNSLKANSIGKEYAYNMKKNFEKNVEPLLPKGLKLVDVSVSVLDSVVKTLYKSEKQSSTVGVIIYSFSLPLKEAVRLNIIEENPTDKILKTSQSDKERGVLTREEVIALRNKLEEKKNTLFPSFYYGILLGIITGMRISEIRALCTDDIVPSSNPELYKVIIRHSVGYLSGLKSTKGKYERAVLIPSTLGKALILNASPDGVVLPSPQCKKSYMSVPALRGAFYTLLEDISIDKEERERRNITFHSLRHTFSTLARDEDIPQEDRMLVLGHKTTAVNDRYTHSSDDALERVSKLSLELYESALKSAEM